MNESDESALADDGKPDSRTEEWLAGTARAVITPENLTWLAGYSARDQPAQGTKRDLHATAVAITDAEGNDSVILNVELISIPTALRDALERDCRERWELTPQSLLVSATHTHCGPILSEVRAKMYGHGESGIAEARSYQEWVTEVLVDLVGDALEDRQPAELSYARSRCGIAMNRRQSTEEGMEIGLNPEGPVDHDVPVLAVESEETLRAVLFGYTCHPTTAMGDRYSGDWPGYAQEYLEADHPDAVALCILGCAGDQNPQPRRSDGLVEQHGRTMANAVQSALDAPRRTVHGPLRTAFEDVMVEFEAPPSRNELEEWAASDDPYRRRHAETLLDELETTGTIQTTYPFSIQALGFGSDLTMVALSGEMLVRYSLRLKDDLSGPLWVAGYTNDSFTYIPTAQGLAEGGYEGGGVTKYRQYPARLKPSVEQRVLDKARALANRVSAP